MEPHSSPSPEQMNPLPASPEVQQEAGSLEAQPEQAPASYETENQAGNAANQNQQAINLPQVDPVVIPPAPVIADPVVQDTQAPAITGAPASADDTDTIEKEWVDKAKSIVKNTKDDPRQQNNQVSHLRADYMQKRFGKTIKLPDDKA